MKSSFGKVREALRAVFAAEYPNPELVESRVVEAGVFILPWACLVAIVPQPAPCCCVQISLSALGGPTAACPPVHLVEVVTEQFDDPEGGVGVLAQEAQEILPRDEIRLRRFNYVSR